MKALQTYMFSLLLVAGTLAGCEKDRRERGCETSPTIPCAVDSNMVNIRVYNQSRYPICDLNMKYNLSDSLLLGSIKSGDSTCFVPVSNALVSPGLVYTMGTEDDTLVPGSFGTTILSDPKTFITFYINIDIVIDSVATLKEGEDVFELFPRISPQVEVYP